jgi:hypothetical protein
MNIKNILVIASLCFFVGASWAQGEVPAEKNPRKLLSYYLDMAQIDPKLFAKETAGPDKKEIYTTRLELIETFVKDLEKDFELAKAKAKTLKDREEIVKAARDIEELRKDIVRLYQQATKARVEGYFGEAEVKKAKHQ